MLCVIRPWAGGQGWEVAPPGWAFRVQSWRRAARPVACGEGDLVPGAARTQPLPSALCAKPWSFQAKRSQPLRSSRKPRQSCLLELQPGVTVSPPDPVQMFNPLYGEQTVLHIANLWRSARIPRWHGPTWDASPPETRRREPRLHLPTGWFFQLRCQAELLCVPKLLHQGNVKSSAPAATWDLCKSQVLSDLG